jgi:hypothetical protein
MKKKIVSGILILAMLSVAGCEADSDYPGVDRNATYSITDQEYKCIGYASMSPEEIVAGLTLEEGLAYRRLYTY